MTSAVFYKTKWFRNLLIFLFVAGCLFFLGQRLWSNWGEIQYAIANVQPRYLWVSLVVLAVSFLLRPVGFFIFLQVNSNRVSYSDNFRAMYISQLAKYLPGGVWVYPSRVIVFKESGVDVGISSLGLVFESVTLILSSVIASSFLFFRNTQPFPWFSGMQLFILIASCVGGVVFLLFPQVFEMIFPNLFRKAPYLIEFNQLGIRSRLLALVSTIVIFLLVWILSGVSFYYLILGFDPGVTIGVLTSTGIFALSWLVGFISIFNPGGVGIREAIMVLLLGVYLLEPVPLLVAIASRLFWSLLEVLFFLIAGLVKGHARKH